jgi:hypothetical protein
VISHVAFLHQHSRSAAYCIRELSDRERTLYQGFMADYMNMDYSSLLDLR